MELREKLFLLHQMEGVGNGTLYKFLRSDWRNVELHSIRVDDWKKIVGNARLGERIYDELSGCSFEKHLTSYTIRAIDFITLVDEHYPELLRHTSDPPVVLYGRGNWEMLDLPKIAIVGTRVATVYGKKVATQFAQQLAEAGVCIVSGMASGIDGCAHAGALDVKGATIAVLGSSLEYAYPNEHKLLHERIAVDGLLLSEYPLGTAPRAGLFPMRNRIIAGLSRGILVVEAALRSGSLITAYTAVDESRDIFAIPGPLTSPKSAGTLELIKRGAKMVTAVEDILQDYANDSSFSPIPLQVEGGRVSTSEKQVGADERLTMDELRLLEMLSGSPVSFDELLELLQYEFGQLHALLLSLLLKKRILQHPGMCYTLNN